MTFGAFLIGVSNSVIFPQTLTLPRQYNYKISTQTNSTFMLFAAIGDGSFAVVVGYTMKLTADMLFYGMAAMNISLLLLLKMATKKFMEDVK